MACIKMTYKCPYRTFQRTDVRDAALPDLREAVVSYDLANAQATADQASDDLIALAPLVVVGAATVTGWDGNPDHVKLADTSHMPMESAGLVVYDALGATVDPSHYVVDLAAGTFDFAGHPMSYPVTVDYTGDR
jgi:hypothetical protein